MIKFTPVLLIIGVLFTILLGASLLQLLGNRNELTPTSIRPSLLLTLVLTTIILVPYLISASLFPLLEVRYAIFAFPAVAVILARSLQSLSTQKATAIALICLIILLSIGLGAYYQTETSEDWKGLTESLESEDLSNDLIVYYPAYIEDAVSFYLSEPSSQQARTVSISEANELESVLEDTSFESVWVVSYSPPSTVEALLESQGYSQTDERSFGNIELLQYSEGTD